MIWLYFMVILIFQKTIFCRKYCDILHTLLKKPCKIYTRCHTNRIHSHIPEVTSVCFYTTTALADWSSLCTVCRLLHCWLRLDIVPVCDLSLITETRSSSWWLVINNGECGGAGCRGLTAASVTSPPSHLCSLVRRSGATARRRSMDPDQYGSSGARAEDTCFVHYSCNYYFPVI